MPLVRDITLVESDLGGFSNLDLSKVAEDRLAPQGISWNTEFARAVDRTDIVNHFRWRWPHLFSSCKSMEDGHVVR